MDRGQRAGDMDSASVPVLDMQTHEQGREKGPGVPLPTFKLEPAEPGSGSDRAGPLSVPSQGLQRSASPVPSCVSMKSDWSHLPPPNFSGEGTHLDPSHGLPRPASPVPSGVSMKSDWSHLPPPNFSGEGTHFDPSHGLPRPASPVPSGVSMKSDWSHLPPPNFSGEGTHLDPSHGLPRPASPVPSGVSMKSDWSHLPPPNFSGEGTHFDPSEIRDCLTLGPPICTVCEQVLTCPVSSLNCGHRFCLDCVSSYLDESGTATCHSCPVCGKDALKNVKQAHKVNLKARFECISEGCSSPETQTLLERVYTDLHITEGECEGVNKEHEVRQIETMLRSRTSVDTAINCNDIFKPLPGRERYIRTVLTKGIAGIGKTVSVQKFILDWVKGFANQDIDFVFALPFREVNLIKSAQNSLHGLLLNFHPELKVLRGSKQFQACQLVFIFDGLDESQLTLSFLESQVLSDIMQISSVDVLITNLLQGNLLPSARIWITSRPAAADQIPAKCVHQVTEVRGFSDPQKEEYFRKRIGDLSQAARIISHLKSSKSLHIMCHIPVFCWISASVLQQILGWSNAEIPKTLTEMFIHFLLIQTIRKDQKYHEGRDSDRLRILESNRDIILKLSKLAFKHLEKGNLMFYEEDLQECGIDIQDAAVYCGMCTEIFREESLFGRAKIYSFVHVTIQEFLSALYIFHSYVTKNREALVSFCPDETSSRNRVRMGSLGSLKDLFKGKSTAQPEDSGIHVLLKGAVDKSLQSKNGHLDLFLRFLLGISLQTNQKLLEGLLTCKENTSKGISKTIAYVKTINETEVSPERYINLFHCLLEMNDHSIQEKIQRYLQSEKKQKKLLSPSHCSALACMLLMSESTLDELDLRRYNTCDEGRRRLIPAVRCCRRALLSGCHLSVNSIEVVLSALALANSPLKELDLSDSLLQDSTVLQLATQLRSPHCQLDTLRLSSCGLTEHGCSSLASILSLPASLLRVLDLSRNQLYDTGATQLSEQLKGPRCKLEALRLSSCRLSGPGCDALAQALDSSPSCLKELDLRHNHITPPSAHLLIAALQNPSSKLETLGMNGAADFWLEAGPGQYSCELTLDENTANDHLAFSDGCSKVRFLEDPQLYSNHPDRFSFWPLVLCKEALTGRGYWELDWTGQADIGVAYKSIDRKLYEDQCVLGHNDQSWSLECHDGHHYRAWRRNVRVDIVSPPHIQSKRVGVYVDSTLGMLSFYSVSTDMIHHLHTYRTAFSNPLHPGFMIWPDSSVTLCKIQMRVTTRSRTTSLSGHQNQ